MGLETTFKHPPRGHVGLLGYDANIPTWRALVATGDGHLPVEESGLPGTPTVYNLTMTLAATEYSQALPDGTRKFTVQCRAAYAVQISFTSGQSGTTFLTVKSGCAYWEDHVDAVGVTVYARCATAGQVLEIVCWT